jgi:hypothetical protein
MQCNASDIRLDSIIVESVFAVERSNRDVGATSQCRVTQAMC